MDFRLKDKLYLNVPFDEKDDVKEDGAIFDGDVKRWYITADMDPLKFRRYWSFLECPYKDKEKAKAKGARFDRNTKKWYVPAAKDFDDFAEWWPSQLKQFIFDNQYATAEMVSSSGQSSVYRAYNLETYEEVAIKFFATDEDKPEMKEAFFREMKAYETLADHKGVLDVLAWGQHEPTKRMFVVYPYCEWDLDEFLSAPDEELVDKVFDVIKATFDEDDLDLDEFEKIRADTIKEMNEEENDVVDSWEQLSPILDALAYAYGRGIIHRDIKPANILLNIEFNPETEEHDFVCYLADFGMSKLKDLEMNFGPTFVDWMSPPWSPPRSETEKFFQDTWDVHGWAMCFIADAVDQVFGNYEEAEAALDGKFKSLASENLHALMARCVHTDPSERPANITVLHEEMNTLMDEIIQGRGS
jgi:serine/threonine protein kinase